MHDVPSRSTLLLMLFKYAVSTDFCVFRAMYIKVHQSYIPGSTVHECGSIHPHNINRDISSEAFSHALPKHSTALPRTTVLLLVLKVHINAITVYTHSFGSGFFA